MEAKVITDPSGRATATFSDDRGKPYKFASNAVNVTGTVTFIEAIVIPLTEDLKLPVPRPALTRGQILISVQSNLAGGSGVTDFLLADVQVLGYVGSVSSIIWRGNLGGDRPLARVTFDDGDTFDRIVIAARQNVDGDFSTVVATPGICLIAAVADMWS